MIAGYAHWRPAVHPRIINLVRRRLRISGRVPLALDIGCGAGLSTAALEVLADRVIGIEPVSAMLTPAAEVAPLACFAAGRAEQLPIRSGLVDLATAAGSLNWADLSRFFPETRRVLRPSGRLVIYDFGMGRDFRGSAHLARWCEEFDRRYPPPPASELGPGSIHPEPYGIRITGQERFEVAIALTPEFYLEYALTETGVAAAIQRGTPASKIRAWCRRSLAAVFNDAVQEVLFRGYIIYAAPTSPRP